MEVDLVVCGGGLAGLSAALMAGRMGFSVALVEKKTYPFHKVCGEYLSLESRSLIGHLGIPTKNLPLIDTFFLSHPSAGTFSSPLPLGGLGISRNFLDSELCRLVREEGGLVLENMRVVGHRQEGEKHVIELDNGNQILSKFAFGSFGRNKPGFLRETENRQGRSYTGVKMHLAHDDFPRDQIELHHFPGGYAGMSAIEDGHYCFAYLVDDEVVRTCRGNLDQVEIQFLQKNPHLKKRLLEGRSVWGRTTTSGVHFRPRPLSDSGLLFLGDTAGMIPPLAGNGMSMALHSAVLACNLLSQTRSGLSKNDLIKAYTRDWNASFSKRLQQARRLQTIMEQPGMTAFTLQIFRLFPGLFRLAAKGTHGVEIPLPKG